MNNKRTLRQVCVALVLLVSFLFQGTWALAGVTGGLRGVIQDDKGAPVAGAAVKVVSASQIATATTDSAGRFSFLSLAPDTYSVSVDKSGFNPISEAGVTVFADQQQTLTFRMTPSLKTIAKVTSTAAGALVKGGVGGDIYSVSSAQIQAASSLGGGGNLNSAYSAMSSVPGVNVPTGGAGWNQSVYIRGSQSFFTGFEYDGVPVNRAFDNYNASTESNLGLQELQVYTGGGPAATTSSGTSGFINQVIKTGTYPGYLSLNGGIGSTAFYHQAKVEAGGATPDRNFSYYVGISGYDQANRVIDNSNGAGLMGPGGIYAGYSGSNAGLSFNIAAANGAYALCNGTDGSTPNSVLNLPSAANPASAINQYGSFCFNQFPGQSGAASFIADRENVVNFHFGIPRKNGQRDDLQLLWSSSMLKTYTYGDVNDQGGANTWALAAFGAPYTGYHAPTGINNPTGIYPRYEDSYQIPTPFGSAVTASQVAPYFFPDSPTNRPFASELPFGQQDAVYNDQGIVKAQYTHSLGEKAFARLVGYTFFSDWNQTGPYATLANYIFGWPSEALAANYLLNTHTAGGEFQFTDELNDQHLLQFTANYTKANVLRWNNTGFITVSASNTGGNGNPVGILSPTGNAANPYNCWSSAAGGDAMIPCYQAGLTNAKTLYRGGAIPTVGPNAAAAGAHVANLWNGGESGSYNTVKPQFTNLSLNDQFRPNDKWLFNLGLRYDSYTYGLPNAADTADNFYAAQVANYTCYDTNTNNPNPVYSNPLLPGQFPPAAAVLTNQDCNAYVTAHTGTAVSTYVHPNGTTQDGIAAPSFNTNMPSSYNLHYWSARVSGTYTQSPDTVWRGSAGRFVEPPISASVQYLNKSGNNRTQWANAMDLGFFTPFHAIPAQTSGQYDISLERHIRGTDMSFKVSPFYNITNGYQSQSFIGAGFVTQIPVGKFRSEGVEFAFTKGDFAKNGLSGTFALTYTDAKVQYQKGLVNGFGQNQIDILNQAITDYNTLTTSAPCYDPTAGQPNTPVAACGPGMIANPYFGKAKQSTMDPNGWYVPSSLIVLPGVNTVFNNYDSPWVGTILLNYRHDKWAITPSIQWVTGASYGSPVTVQGIDPRECAATDPSASAPANQCDYTTLQSAGATATGLLYIPNPQTGSFDTVGQYRNPTILTGNLAMTYDVSPRISLNLTLANIFHTCYGGSKTPWTSAYAPSSNICGYAANGAYVSNYQLGKGAANPGNIGAYDAAANGTTLYPWQQQSYAPTAGSFAGTIPQPFNAFLTVNIKV